MRDSHKLKEKFELSLESSQIVTIAVAGLVVLGGVFVLGVVVGKKLAGEPAPQAQQQDLLAALDEKSKAVEAKPDASLTFQAELTKATPPPAAPPKDKPAEAPKPPADAPKLAEAPKPPEPAPAPKAAEPAPEPSTEPAPVVEAPKPKPAEVKLAEQVKVEPTPARTNDAGALKEALARGIKGGAEAPVPQPPLGTFALQLSAYQDRAEADRFAAGLKDKGYAPYVVEAAVAGKGTWYRVRMGRFTSRDAAQRYLSDFKRETSLDAFVTNN